MALNRLKPFIISVIFLISINCVLHAQLKGNSNQADYIVITPSQFVITIQQFVDWRQHKNLNVKIVELEQIYSEFSDTTKSNSIREFVSHALTFWENPKPKYLLLVGGTKLLPTYKISSFFSQFWNIHEDSVSIDEWFSVNLYESNTKPDIALGRFPVNNEQELKNIISKTIHFEDSLSALEYPTDFTILTDKTDSVAFEQVANQFINTILPSFFSKINLFAGQDSNIETTRFRFLSSLNNGTLFLSYYGHGAPNRFSKYNFFTFSDIDSIKKTNLPFIYSSAACSQSFDPPNDSSIVRKLIVSNNNGAVAAINSTGINLLHSGSEFLSTFYSYVFKNPELAIGDAVLNAKLAFFSNTTDDIPRRYTLLGDPALKIPFKTITNVSKEQKIIPNSYSLNQNFPNPFNPSTTISYSIPKESIVKIVVYDILGAEISILVNEKKQAGYHEIVFNGSSLPSGIYFYQMRADNFVEVKKFVLMK